MGKNLNGLHIYSEAFKPARALVRMIPQIPALRSQLEEYASFCLENMTYNIPRLRPQATVIFSFCFMFRSQTTNHGRIAKAKSAATNHASRLLGHRENKGAKLWATHIRQYSQL